MKAINNLNSIPKILLLFILSSLFVISCENETPIGELEIQYEFLDDVSPVKTILSVNENITWAEWIINDSLRTGDFSDVSPKFIFNHAGISKIELEAFGEDGEKYFAITEVEIPARANTLTIKGYEFKENYNFDIEDDSLRFSFNYYNSIDSAYTYYKTIISKSTFENNNTVMFESPIDINIIKSLVDPTAKSQIYFIIKGESTNNEYFKINFHINDAYFVTRIDEPHSISLRNFLGDDKEQIHLSCDWTR